ncbi:MAG: LacI family DNA-binding transcriptional regulator [Alphaproteobacteria bacterium]
MRKTVPPTRTRLRKSRQKSRPAGAPKTKVTIREVARRARVSTATVSRALNQPEKVRAKTRERVLRVVRETHFVFDGIAASMISGRSRTIGLIIPTIMNSIYAASTQAIQRTAQAAGYTVLLGISEFSPQQEADLAQRLLERRADGLILTGGNHDQSLIEKMQANGVPFLITWKLMHGKNWPSVSFDNYKAAQAAVDFLVSLGHRRLGLVCGRTDINDRALDRRRAFEDCLKRHGLAVDPALIYERDFEMEEGVSAMSAMLDTPEPPTAVFCANDVQAIGALSLCREKGLSVPGDISIIGFDDLPATSYTRPKLTTVRVPAHDMGRRAAEIMIASIERGIPLQSVELKTELIARETTAPPRSRS